MTSMMVSILALQLLPPAAVAHLEGPIASAVTREAVRIAQQPPSTIHDDWSRVVAVAPGTYIALTRTTDRWRMGCCAPCRRHSGLSVVALELRVANVIGLHENSRPCPPN
jgi:hypothetical protein